MVKMLQHLVMLAGASAGDDAEVMLQVSKHNFNDEQLAQTQTGNVEVNNGCRMKIEGACSRYPHMSNANWFDDAESGGVKAGTKGYNTQQNCEDRRGSWQLSCGSSTTISMSFKPLEQVNLVNQCLDALGNSPASFSLPESMRVSDVIFTHKSGGVTCSQGHHAPTNFGCGKAGNLGLVIIKKGNKDVLMPLASQKIEGFTRVKLGGAHWYTIQGVGAKTEQMPWKFGIQPELSAGTYEVWYNEDLSDHTEGDNAGKACYDIEIFGDNGNGPTDIFANGGNTIGSGKDIFENCLKGDFNTRKTMGSGAHTIRATVKMPSAIPTEAARQWILNLGGDQSGANHWMWTPKLQREWYGRWHSDRVESVTTDEMMEAASLTTTFDGQIYNFYIDGQLKHTRVMETPLDIQNNVLTVGVADPSFAAEGDIDFKGCVTKVEVWDSALTPNELAK